MTSSHTTKWQVAIIFRGSTARDKRVPPVADVEHVFVKPGPLTANDAAVRTSRIFGSSMIKASLSPVSVIIPTFNRAGFITEAIESVLNQSRPPREVIVVDDGSTDETEAVVARFGERVVYVGKENGGKSSAINLALPMTSSEFVWIFDDDDFAYPDAIESHLELHRLKPGLGFTFGAHHLGETGPDGRIRRIPSPPAPGVFDAPIELQRLNLLKYCAFMLSACIVRRSAFVSAGPFREDLHRSQDYEMLIRLSQGCDFAYTGSSTYILRKHEGVRGPAANQHGNTERIRVWRDYDRKIGESIAETLPLARYLATASNADAAPNWQRTALIRRAWVMASKAHIEQLVADLVAAASHEHAEPAQLSVTERECCQSLCDHRYFLMCLFDDPHVLRPLRRLGRDAVGAEMLKAMGKGLYWKAVEKGSDLSLVNRARLLRTAAGLILVDSGGRTGVLARSSFRA